MLIRLTPVHTIYSGRRLLFSSKNLTAFDWLNVDRLLSKAIEQQPTGLRASTIKTKHKFVQIIVQMRGQGFVLMSSYQPSFQQGNYEIGQRQQVFTNISRFSNNRMFITKGCQGGISFPTISTDFALGSNTFFNRRHQAGSRSIFNFMQTDSSRALIFSFNRHKNQRFASSATAPFTRARSSNIGFINLRRADQLIAARTNHSNPQSVKHGPSCFVSFKSKYPLQSQSTNALLLADNLPHSSKPQAQGKASILENGSSRNRNLKTAMATMEVSPSRSPSLSMAATRTNKSFRPSQLIQIFSTCFFSSKILFKFKHRLGIAFHNPCILYLVGAGVKRISIKSFLLR